MKRTRVCVVGFPQLGLACTEDGSETAERGRGLRPESRVLDRVYR